jgi:hypothetical protein
LLRYAYAVRLDQHDGSERTDLNQFESIPITGSILAFYSDSNMRRISARLDPIQEEVRLEIRSPRKSESRAPKKTPRPSLSSLASISPDRAVFASPRFRSSVVAFQITLKELNQTNSSLTDTQRAHRYFEMLGLFIDFGFD